MTEPGGVAPQDLRREALLKEYGEVVGNFRLLTDIRFKLLALLPVASGAAVGVIWEGTGSDGAAEARAIGLSLFGLVVTVALATYNDRNDQLYDTLVGRAASIERQVGLPDGAFSNRPTNWFGIRYGLGKGWPVNHRHPVALIYGASVAVWLFSAVAALIGLCWGDDEVPWWPLGLALAAAVLVPVLAVRAIRGQRKARQTQMRRDARLAVEEVESALRADRTGVSLGDLRSFVEGCMRLAGVRRRDACSRIRFYGRLGPDEERRFVGDGPDRRRAAQLVALIADLPPEWLEDCATGRRVAPGPRTSG